MDISMDNRLFRGNSFRYQDWRTSLKLLFSRKIRTIPRFRKNYLSLSLWRGIWLVPIFRRKRACFPSRNQFPADGTKRLNINLFHLEQSTSLNDLFGMGNTLMKCFFGGSYFFSSLPFLGIFSRKPFIQKRRIDSISEPEYWCSFGCSSTF